MESKLLTGSLIGGPREGDGEGRAGNFKGNRVGEGDLGAARGPGLPQRMANWLGGTEEQGTERWMEQAKPMARLPRGRLTLSVLLLGVVGQG